MKYNIKTHILDHAHYVLGDLPESNKKLTHFNTSVCASYFIRRGLSTQNEIDSIMVEILKNIKERKLNIREKNGTYTKKNGKKVQKYRTRIIKFDKILTAYHNRHFNSSKSVMPHFHFLFDDFVRVGKDFIYLKQALEEEAKKYHIKFNFMEERQVTGLSKKQLSRISNMSWLLNQGNVPRIKKYLSNSEKVHDTLNLLHTHYQNTQNISFFIKVLSILNQRLQEVDMDFIYKNINLKESIYFFLSERQKNLLTNLEKGRTVEIKLSSVFDREILKKAHHFQSDAMDIVSKKFNLVNLSPKQLSYPKKDDRDILNFKKTNSFRKLIIKDLRNSLAYAKSEKDWREILLKMGYIKVSINSSKKFNKRVKIAITITTKKKSKVYIPFYTMGLDFKKITKIMMYNKKQNRKKNNYDNSVDDYIKIKKRQQEILKKYTVQMKLLLKIYTNSSNQNNVNEKELKNLAIKYTIHTSEMYKITTYQAESATIVDNNSSITLKKFERHIENCISDMLDIAVLKSWNLESLIIEGSSTFIEETKKQIKVRLKSNKVQEKTMSYTRHIKI